MTSSPTPTSVFPIPSLTGIATVDLTNLGLVNIFVAGNNPYNYLGFGTMEIIIEPEVYEQGGSVTGLITGLALYGTPLVSDEEHTSVYNADAYKNTHFKNKIYAEQFCGVIDDGSIDGGVF